MANTLVNSKLGREKLKAVSNGHQGQAYKPRLISRRGRRTKAEITTICDALYDLLKDDNPQTVRQVFYRAVSAGIVAKTENEYKNTVGRLLIKMRMDGQIPFGWIADNTRWMRKPKTFSSMEDALRNTAQTYRRALWDD